MSNEHKQTLENVIFRLENSSPTLSVGERRLWVKSEHRLGMGGLGAAYRSGDHNLVLKVGVVLTGLPPIPPQDPLPVACVEEESAGERKLRFLHDGKEVASTALGDHERRAYRRAQVEQHVGKNVTDIEGSGPILEGEYFLWNTGDTSCLLMGLLMPFFPGKTLDEFMVSHKDGENLSLQEKLRIVAQVGRTIQDYQRRGIVHGDIKPGNIIIDKNRKPTIIDYGIAHLLCAEEEPLDIIGGTAEYIAPEVADHRVHRTTDLYSLGLIAYELLTGTLPYPHQLSGEEGVARTSFFHFVYLATLLKESKLSQKFYQDVGQSLCNRGCSFDLAESIARTLYPQVKYRGTDLPDVAERFSRRPLRPLKKGYVPAADIHFPETLREIGAEIPPKRD